MFVRIPGWSSPPISKGHLNDLLSLVKQTLKPGQILHQIVVQIVIIELFRKRDHGLYGALADCGAGVSKAAHQVPKWTFVLRNGIKFDKPIYAVVDNLWLQMSGVFVHAFQKFDSCCAISRAEEFYQARHNSCLILVFVQQLGQLKHRIQNHTARIAVFVCLKTKLHL